jgi:hypothetical protein
VRLPKRDLIATVLVAVAVMVYLLWALDAALPGLGSARASGLVVLGLGFAASASAVVPTFLGLLHGNKAYLAVTSLLGVAALAGGLMTLISASAWGFAVMMIATAGLWLISTVHHRMLALAASTPSCPNCGRPVRRLRCEVCGYEVIERAREKAMHVRGG